MKYAILKYQYDINGQMNIGDYIQSLAAKTFLPQIDEYIDREALNDYNGDSVKLIMNGWFMHNPQNWPPCEKITPLYISFHLTPGAAESVLNESGINHLKKHEPIGCRDMSTFNLLQTKGIAVYLSSCLTLTLPSIKRDINHNSSKNIYVVDILNDYPDFSDFLKDTFLNKLRKLKNGTLKKMLEKKFFLNKVLHFGLKKDVKYLSHYFNDKLTHEEWIDKCEKLMEKYADAKLVITSRIHCALPCLAMGVPVIFVNEGFQNFGMERINDMLPFFNEIWFDEKKNINKRFAFYSKGKINSKTILKNFDKHEVYATKLTKTCKEFISNK